MFHVERQAVSALQWQARAEQQWVPPSNLLLLLSRLCLPIYGGSCPSFHTFCTLPMGVPLHCIGCFGLCKTFCTCVVGGMIWEYDYAGYWSSWQGESACNSPQMKQFLGLGDEDSCLGFYILGTSSSDAISSYRSKRGPMADKIAWK